MDHVRDKQSAPRSLALPGTLAACGAYLLSCLLAPQLQAQFAETDIEIFSDLEAVRVTIEAPNAAAIGLDQNLLKREVENLLDRGHVPVATAQDLAGLSEADREISVPALHFRIVLIPVPGLFDTYAYRIDLELREMVDLFRSSARLLNGTTWRANPRQGITGDRGASEIARHVTGMTEEFIQIYLSANPRLRVR